MYFDKDFILDIRLNAFNKYVDKFVIVESGDDHQETKKISQLLILLKQKRSKNNSIFF